MAQGTEVLLDMAYCPNGCGTETHSAGVDGTDWCDPCVTSVLLEQAFEDNSVLMPQVFST